MGRHRNFAVCALFAPDRQPVREGTMRELTRRLAVAAAFFAIAVAGLPVSPAEAHHFGRFGFGFGFPVVYAAPPIYPVYVPPPVYPVYAPPPVVYHYGYRYRVHHYYRRVAVRHVVHHRWCGCTCCH
jgi:hypothetical protein